MNHTVVHASPAYEQIGGWGVKEIVADLHAARDRWRAAQQRSLEFAVREFPAREALKEIAEALCGALFPMRLGPPDLHQEGENFYVGHTLDKALIPTARSFRHQPPACVGLDLHRMSVGQINAQAQEHARKREGIPGFHSEHVATRRQ